MMAGFRRGRQRIAAVVFQPISSLRKLNVENGFSHVIHIFPKSLENFRLEVPFYFVTLANEA